VYLFTKGRRIGVGIAEMVRREEWRRKSEGGNGMRTPFTPFLIDNRSIVQLSFLLSQGSRKIGNVRISRIMGY
jgi:hypothetical protein